MSSNCVTKHFHPMLCIVNCIKCSAYAGPNPTVECQKAVNSTE